MPMHAREGIFIAERALTVNEKRSVIKENNEEISIEVFKSCIIEPGLASVDLPWLLYLYSFFNLACQMCMWQLISRDDQIIPGVCFYIQACLRFVDCNVLEGLH